VRGQRRPLAGCGDARLELHQQRVLVEPLLVRRDPPQRRYWGVCRWASSTWPGSAHSDSRHGDEAGDDQNNPAPLSAS
jgi:hypothetical protein